MPIEEDFTNALRAELSDCEPDLYVILTEGVRIGRSHRRRRLRLLIGSAVLVAGGLAGALVPVLPGVSRSAGRPGLVAVVPATTPSRAPLPSHSPLPSATPSPTHSPLAGEPYLDDLPMDQVMVLLRGLLPSGVVLSRPAPKQGVVSPQLWLDDGHGRCLLMVSVFRMDPQQTAQARAQLRTVAAPRADGTLASAQQFRGPGYAPYQFVQAVRPDGLVVLMTLSQAPTPNAEPVRSAPVLSAAQLTAIATSPVWATGEQ